ncbi:MAG: LacI family DNA-binding transcriptional regulator [Pseudomonadota bacterium]
MAGIADIAKAAGVSTAVVSRVINGDSTLRIAEETRKRVLRIAEEHDYAPNSAASSLRSSHSGLIAMVVHDVTNPVYAEILSGAQHQATLQGQAILISEASALDNQASRLLRLIGGRGVDGLILQSVGQLSDTALARAARKKIPTVLLQTELDADATLLTLPDIEAAELATQHLIDLGHARIGCLATREGLTFTQNRVEGWQTALHAAGLEVENSALEFADPAIDDGRMMARKILEANPDLTGLVCCNAVSAIGALEAASQMQIDVPNQLSIVAIHDIEMARHLRIPLTTVKMPLFEMGVRAIEMLSGSQSVSAGRVAITEQPVLVERSSTRVL